MADFTTFIRCIRERAFEKARREFLNRRAVLHTAGDGTSSVTQGSEAKRREFSQATVGRFGATTTKLAVSVLLLAGLAILLRFSLYLAASRMYEISECRNVFAAKSFEMGHFAAGANVFQILLSWLLPNADHSVDLFASARLLMVVIFWSNWILIAMATGERLTSVGWLLAVVGAATLAPFWDYGFEIRPDNLLLAGLLFVWCLVRFEPATLPKYFIVGLIVVALEFVTFETMFYTAPFCFAILAFPPYRGSIPRWKLGLALAAGAVVSLASLCQVCNWSGVWAQHLADVRSSSSASTEGNPVAPWNALPQLVSQAPLLMALVASGVVAVGMDLARRGRNAMTWDGIVPEALLFIGVSAALMLNPAAPSDNLFLLAPYAFLLAFRHGAILVKEFSGRAAMAPAVLAIIVFIHFVPFGLATRKHLSRHNTDQETLMSEAETLTDPAKDVVYDAIGMVPTRSFVGSLSLDSYVQGPGPQARNLLVADPPAVFISECRTDPHFAVDENFIRQHYVPFSDDFWVLGNILPRGGGTFRILHRGRYRISSIEGSDIMGTYPGGWGAITTPENEGSLKFTLDGVTMTNGPVELAPGMHRIETRSDTEPAVVWVGPRVDRIHRFSVSLRAKPDSSLGVRDTHPSR